MDPKAAVSCHKTILLLFLACLIGGCAQSPVYDENRDKQGVAAKKAATELKLVDSIATLEKSMDDLAALEEEQARSGVKLSFERELKAAVRATSIDAAPASAQGGTPGLLTFVNRRLATLGVDFGDPGKAAETIKKIQIQRASLTAFQRTLNSHLNDFEGTVGYRFKSCAEVFAASSNPKEKTPEASTQFLARIGPATRGSVQEQYPPLVDSCVKVTEAEFSLEKLGLKADGEIGKLTKHQSALAKELQDFESGKANAKVILDKAVAEFNAASDKQKGSDGKTTSQTVEERAKKLEAIVQALGRQSSKLGEGEAAATATEKLKHLENVLTAVAEAGGDKTMTLSREDQASVAIIRDLPALKDDADKLLSDAKRPRLVPLVLAVDYQRLAVQSNDAQSAILRQKFESIAPQIDGAADELLALAKVADRLTSDTTWASQSIAQLQQALKGKEQFRLLDALAIYGDDIPRFRAQTKVWRSRELALEYKGALIRSEYVAQQWDATIVAIATVLNDYHASGIKNADLAEFFKAIGLVVIGIGVAQ